MGELVAGYPSLPASGMCGVSGSGAGSDDQVATYPGWIRVDLQDNYFGVFLALSLLYSAMIVKCNLSGPQLAVAIRQYAAIAPKSMH